MCDFHIFTIQTSKPFTQDLLTVQYVELAINLAENSTHTRPLLLLLDY